jgi:hypothetical protein
MLELRGVIIFGIQDGLVAWSRMYLDPVEQGLSLDDLPRIPLPTPG